MKQLSQLAAKDFLWATRTSFSVGLATWTETLDRLVALRGMSSPHDPSAIFAKHLLLLNEWPAETDWLGDEHPHDDELYGDSNATPSRIRRQLSRDPEEGGEPPAVAEL